MEGPTKDQIKAVQSMKRKTYHVENKTISETYVWPCCGVEVLNTPIIENAGEDLTQIRCLYGCGFIYVEHWL